MYMNDLPNISTVPVLNFFIFFFCKQIFEIYCAASIKICINECGCLCLWETWLRNLNLVWHLAEEILKRFFQNQKTLYFSYKKKSYGAENLYGPRHFNCGWKIDKSNKKKYERKKAHAEDRTQTSSGLTAKFKFLSFS